MQQSNNSRNISHAQIFLKSFQKRMNFLRKKSVYIGEGINTRILVVSQGTVLRDTCGVTENDPPVTRELTRNNKKVKVHREPSPVSTISQTVSFTLKL